MSSTSQNAQKLLSQLKDIQSPHAISMWPDTVAKMRYRTRYGKGLNSVVTVRAGIDNLSSKGMLVLTDDLIPALRQH